MNGEFETHLTLAPMESAQVEQLRAFAAGHGLKISHIVLSQGAQISQPMLTFHRRGTLVEVQAESARLAAEFAARGHEVRRTKMEVEAAHALAPTTLAEAVALPMGRYFEHHLKLRLPALAETAALDLIGQRHCARLSRNALRVRTDATEERFLTQRFHHTPRAEAEASLHALERDLAAAGFEVLEIETEFVIYDSNLQLDAGWFPSSP